MATVSLTITCPEHLKKQATLLSAMLKDLDLPSIISLADTEPDFFTIFGKTEDQVDDWSHATKFRIQDLIIRASKEVSEGKAAECEVLPRSAEEATSLGGGTTTSPGDLNFFTGSMSRWRYDQ